MLQKSWIVDVRIVVEIEFSIDKVSKVRRVVGQVELFEKFDEVVKVEDNRIVLKYIILAPKIVNCEDTCKVSSLFTTLYIKNKTKNS
jgi:hypothetical protein